MLLSNYNPSQFAMAQDKSMISQAYLLEITASSLEYFWDQLICYLNLKGFLSFSFTMTIKKSQEK